MSDKEITDWNSGPLQVKMTNSSGGSFAKNLSEKKTACVKTYGCQMNVYDSEQISNILTNLGYEMTEDYEGADFVLLNTCHIREKAAEKIYSELGRIKIEKDRLKAEGKNMIIAMAGCVAQAEGEAVFKRAKHVDIVVGPESYQELPHLIKRSQLGEKSLINIEFNPDDKFDKLPQELMPKAKSSAFVTIQEGCDKFCSFCVVPYTRGAEFSRNVSEVVKEVKFNVDKGAKEIILLGQNVNAYHGLDDAGKIWKLSDLIAKIAEIDGLERIRYTTSHPCDMTEDLIAMHGYEKKLMPMLNLPVQSGSNKILKNMNRRHTREKYMEIMENLRKNRPDIIFSSDFIVGYPGETDEDFEDTLDLVRKIRFESQCFSFKYSPRPGTPASEKSDQISEDIKSARLKILQDLLESQQHAFNETMLGKTLSVLFEDKPTRHASQVVGRSEFMQIVLCEPGNIPRNEIIHSIRNVKITAVNKNSLIGQIVA